MLNSSSKNEGYLICCKPNGTKAMPGFYRFYRLTTKNSILGKPGYAIGTSGQADDEVNPAPASAFGSGLSSQVKRMFYQPKVISKDSIGFTATRRLKCLFSEGAMAGQASAKLAKGKTQSPFGTRKQHFQSVKRVITNL